MNTTEIHLRDIAMARSGDKGSDSNIGVIAFNQAGYTFLRDQLTADKVQEFFKPLNPLHTTRYDLPNLWAFNFVIEGILEGGGSSSLRIDAQGKTLGQALLEMPLLIPVHLFPQCILNPPAERTS
jgi:hypothetical protein